MRIRNPVSGDGYQAQAHSPKGSATETFLEQVARRLFGFRTPACTSALFCALRLEISGEAAEPAADLKPAALHVGFIKSCFLNVNRADAESAFKVLSETVGRKRGYAVTSRTQGFDTAAEIEAAVNRGTVNLAIVDSWKYLAMDSGGYMKPYFVTSEKAKADMAEILAELHLEPAGQQILTLFKVGPMVPFQESQLDTVRQLRANYERLRKESNP